MSININNLTSTQVRGASDESKLKQVTEKPLQTEQHETVKPSMSDTLDLSENAVQLGKLANTTASSPVVDMQRVEEVKQAIKSGAYEADPAKIADKLMQFESMLKPKA